MLCIVLVRWNLFKRILKVNIRNAVIAYAHPDLEPILKGTYGVIVYQEQIMQIASLLAGFSLAEADYLTTGDK